MFKNRSERCVITKKNKISLAECEYWFPCGRNSTN